MTTKQSNLEETTAADSNDNSGIHAPATKCKMKSFLGLRVSTERETERAADRLATPFALLRLLHRRKARRL